MGRIGFVKGLAMILKVYFKLFYTIYILYIKAYKEILCYFIV